MPKGILGIPPAPCHPDRNHYSKGLCKQCYDQKRKVNPEFRAFRRLTRKPPNQEYKDLSLRRATVKRNKLKTKYGFTPEMVEVLKQSQSGLCAICKQSKPLVLDHDHETDKVRGLLCELCNRGLGHFKDNIEWLKSAILYLGRSKCE